MAVGPEKATALFQAVFDSLDTDRDGIVRWDDFEGTLGRRDPDKARALMDLADVDRRNSITFEGFMDFVQQVLSDEPLEMEAVTEEHVAHFKSMFRPAGE
eukprot:TRINITY_DN7141_c0_g1_i1.p2 TRINITY_DN7141_c0_g1~~TRINITY_DN7141_c0_g1_i1.p2  ORF type:complete len:100 (+),score=42.48 TRINITY_DN7141_c0_g1_i1:53-352(+)